MRNSYFINKIRYIILADGRIVSKILARYLVWFRPQVMVSRGFSNTGDPKDRTNRWNPLIYYLRQKLIDNQFLTKFSNERTFLIDNNFLTIDFLTIENLLSLTMINL